ncbi:MAG TPA: IPT/TIG domain-containing protein [Pseudonocardiaceae bacterium]
MQIDSILPERVSPGQSVVIQGDGLETVEKVFLGDEEVPFDVDGETLVVQVPDVSGEVELTIQGGDGENDTSSITVE